MKSFFLMTLAALLFLLFSFASNSDEAIKGGSTGPGGDSKAPGMQFVYELNDIPSAPVIPPFKKLFPKCMRQVAGEQGWAGCQFQNMGVMPSAEHCAKSPGSCHNVGKAIDIGKIKCGSGEKDPRKDKEFYNKLAECFLTDPELSGKGKFQTVIYAFPQQDIINKVVPSGVSFIQKEDHADHLHVQWDCVTNAPENFKACGQDPSNYGSSGRGTTGGSSGGGSSGGGMPPMSMPPQSPQSSAPANPAPATNQTPATAVPQPAATTPPTTNGVVTPSASASPAPTTPGSGTTQGTTTPGTTTTPATTTPNASRKRPVSGTITAPKARQPQPPAPKSRKEQ